MDAIDTNNNDHGMGWTETERHEYANKMFSEHPKFYPIEHRLSIINGRIVIGMTPHEAKLAGGAFFFHVIPDKTVWPGKYDPYKVMWAQSLHPDNSFIKMTFSNDTQFPGEGVVSFEVIFEHGKATSVTKVKGGEPCRQ